MIISKKVQNELSVEIIRYGLMTLKKLISRPQLTNEVNDMTNKVIDHVFSQYCFEELNEAFFDTTESCQLSLYVSNYKYDFDVPLTKHYPSLSYKIYLTDTLTPSKDMLKGTHLTIDAQPILLSISKLHTLPLEGYPNLKGIAEHNDVTHKLQSIVKESVGLSTNELLIKVPAIKLFFNRLGI